MVPSASNYTSLTVLLHLPSNMTNQHSIFYSILGALQLPGEHNMCWILRSKVDGLIQHRSTINYVKSQRLSWFGHTNRMPESSVVKKIYKWQPFTNRPVGRPKYGWKDDGKNGLKKLKVVKWSDLVQDRHKWQETVEKAKTLAEL